MGVLFARQYIGASSICAWVFVGSPPIGAFFVGSVAETLGVSAAWAAGGGCGLALVALLAAWWRRRGPRFSAGPVGRLRGS